MKRVLALFIAVYSITGFGQTITVIDDEKGYPVKGAAIYNKNLSISIITNDDGTADISSLSLIHI